jgi:hypothetical protein
MAESDVPEIELIIKASTIDGRRKGACIFCQVSFLFFVNPKYCPPHPNSTNQKTTIKIQNINLNVKIE